MDRPADGHQEPGGHGAPSEDDPLLVELAGALPRLFERTRSQVEFSARALSLLPCLQNLFRTPTGPAVPTPEHEARQPTDILSVLATDEPGATAAPAPEVTEPEAAEPEAAAPADVPTSSAPASTEEVPDVDSLAIPGYQSLAASQVIPRLDALSPEELEAVGAYERSTRHRRTILHRVAQLLDT